MNNRWRRGTVIKLNGPDYNELGDETCTVMLNDIDIETRMTFVKKVFGLAPHLDKLPHRGFRCKIKDLFPPETATQQGDGEAGWQEASVTTLRKLLTRNSFKVG